ncbi:hypothetical protein P7K49_021614 [Saguinus oedipus]|uniref:Uncharacterized protein n=1 Tax=Saguinus oedipus TaxID=9490 RepID=A0ABQ9UTW9_SAGOE|nr:hypothetical protein P7K49_021614 [Saguinus oedipus]
MAYGEPSASQAAELRSCYLSSLDLLLEHRLRSVSPGLTPAPPASGYPSEAAAEVVLATLREWLEQHKDKGEFRTPTSLTSPSHRPRRCRAQGQARPFHPGFSCARAPGASVKACTRAGSDRILGPGMPLAQVDRLIICVFHEKDEDIYRSRLPHYFPVGAYYVPRTAPPRPPPPPRSTLGAGSHCPLPSSLRLPQPTLTGTD